MTADAEYGARELERVALRIEKLARAHAWSGGYFCQCGQELNSPEGYVRHLLGIALDPDAEP